MSNRFPAITEEIAGNGFRLSVTVSFDPENGQPVDVHFTQRGKEGTDLNSALHSAGLAASRIMRNEI